MDELETYLAGGRVDPSKPERSQEMTPEQFMLVVRYEGGLREAFNAGYKPEDVAYGEFRDLLELAYAEVLELVVLTHKGKGERNEGA